MAHRTRIVYFGERAVRAKWNGETVDRRCDGCGLLPLDFRTKIAWAAQHSTAGTGGSSANRVGLVLQGAKEITAKIAKMSNTIDHVYAGDIRNPWQNGRLSTLP